jgi:IS30 family transposase
MKIRPIHLGPREQQIADLLLEGCDNAEIAKQLNMARRTVKAHFNRLFLRFGIRSGIKRVKLATLLYRRQLCLEGSAAQAECQVSESRGSSSSSLKDSRIARLHKPSELPNMSSKTTSELSMTSSGSGIGSS